MDGFVQLRPRRPDLVGDVEDPRPHLVRILDKMPRAIFKHDEPVRRPDAGFLLDK